MSVLFTTSYGNAIRKSTFNWITFAGLYVLFTSVGQYSTRVIWMFIDSEDKDTSSPLIEEKLNQNEAKQERPKRLFGSNSKVWESG